MCFAPSAVLCQLLQLSLNENIFIFTPQNAINASYMSSKFGHPLLYTHKPVSLKQELEMPGQVGSFHVSLFEGPSQSEMFWIYIVIILLGYDVYVNYRSKLNSNLSSQSPLFPASPNYSWLRARTQRKFRINLGYKISTWI